MSQTAHFGRRWTGAVIIHGEAMTEPTMTLLPCPFCGGTPKHSAIRDGRELVCSCGAAVRVFNSSHDTLKRTMEAWNRRAAPPSPQPAPETDAPDFLALVRKFYNENGYPDDMALAVGLEGCVGLAKQMYDLGQSHATDAATRTRAALKELVACNEMALEGGVDGDRAANALREAYAALADTGKEQQ